MRTRGRHSAASEAVVVEGSFGQRPPPPEGLTAEQAEVWRATVASEPADYFNGGALKALLTDYCRHRATVEAVSKIIDGFQSEWLRNAEGANRYKQLSKIRDLECRAAVDKATKLRLTNQSRYTPQAAATAAKRATKSAMPWDFDGKPD